MEGEKERSWAVQAFNSKVVDACVRYMSKGRGRERCTRGSYRSVRSAKDNDGHWYDCKRGSVDEHDSNGNAHAGIRPQIGEVV